jgi:methylamine dehydrogenase light chain
VISLIDKLTGFIDRMAETGSRRVARSSGRRSFLARSGTLLVGAALLPVLPFDRGFGTAVAYAAGADGDQNACDYWRYCSLDGNLCSACGGSPSQCPPGSEISKVSWIGTCKNPVDAKDYLVSYSDCCGKPICDNAPFCNTNERERPGYRMGLHNDINWCMANTSHGYHCTVAVLVGIAG